MGKYLGPKCGLCKKEGVRLYLKGTRCYTSKCPIKEGKVTKRSGIVSKRNFQRVSSYGLELKEKQKLRFSYGIRDNQLYNLYQKASKLSGDVSYNLLILLELRFDTIVFRSRIASSMYEAREMISHKYFLINNLPVNIPSYKLKVGDVITVKNDRNISKIRANLLFFEKIGSVSWLDIDKNKIACKLLSDPVVGELNMPVKRELVIEHYSRR